jgi:hypothetical protein
MYEPSAPLLIPDQKSNPLYNPSVLGNNEGAFVVQAWPVPSAPLEQILPAQSPMERFGEVVDKYHISNYFALKLRQLEGYDITIICDDSGSMSCPVINPSSPFEPVETRWSEAQKSLKIIVDIASIFDSDGIDIYYLNRKPIKSVRSAQDLESRRGFSSPPSGSTPLGKILAQVLKDKALMVKEKPVLIIIFTDGEPDNLNEFVSNLKNRSPIERIPICIVACTDDDKSIGYLDKLDKKIKYLDVCDDFLSETKQIKKIQGSAFSFTFGDYIVKILLGSIDHSLDQLDEKKKKSFCTIS